jgi:rhodanese-related sulfurtransferase
MKTIQPTELQNLLANDHLLALVDVRTPVEFAEVHVPQARNIPLDQFEPAQLFADGRASKDAPIYILCRSGARAANAAGKMEKEGFSNGVVVEGGTLAWIDAGLPVHRGKAKVMSLERQVRIAAGTVVLTGLLLAYFVHPYFIGISAFAGAGLVFAGLTDFCGMGLLLARMPWNAKA